MMQPVLCPPTFSDLPENALLQIVGDEGLKGNALYSILLTSKKMNAAITARCETEQLISWIQIAELRGDPKRFLVGRMIYQSWKRSCYDFLEKRYKKGEPLVKTLLEEEIAKLKNLFRDFLRYSQWVMENEERSENEIPIPFHKEMPLLLKRVLPEKSCQAFLSKSCSTFVFGHCEEEFIQNPQIKARITGYQDPKRSFHVSVVNISAGYSSRRLRNDKTDQSQQLYFRGTTRC